MYAAVPIIVPANVPHAERWRQRQWRDTVGCGWSFKHLRETEIQHFHRSVRSNLDVGRLQVAVNDPLLVRRL
jgi:hypothetical protein